MEQTPPPSAFESAYRNGSPPWVVDRAQPAVVELADAGAFTGRVLDLGTGTGEHAVLLAARGLDVLGVDAAPAAIELARERAGDSGARFVVGDALELDPVAAPGSVDTVLDSALLHLLDDGDRVRYAAALARVCRPGASVHVLALAEIDDRGGSQLSAEQVRGTFTGPEWTDRVLTASRYLAMAAPEDAERFGLPLDRPAEFPAWLLRVRRRS